MKKNRPGVCLSILCRAENEQEILEALFRETTTLGVRRNVVDRVFLSRKFVSVSAFGRSVDVKVAYLGNEAVNGHPEFEHCKARYLSAWPSLAHSNLTHIFVVYQAIAVEHNIPLLQVIDEVKALALAQITGLRV
ncbi:hypothetical protein PRNP1_007278 [Phytophthora ramorum]